jgi:hypothetical protein
LIRGTSRTEKTFQNRAAFLRCPGPSELSGKRFKNRRARVFYDVVEGAINSIDQHVQLGLSLIEPKNCHAAYGPSNPVCTINIQNSLTDVACNNNDIGRDEPLLTTGPVGNLVMPHKIKVLAFMKCIRSIMLLLVLLLALTTTPAVSSEDTTYEFVKKPTGWEANDGKRGLQIIVPTPAPAVPTPAPSSVDGVFLNDITGFGDKEQLDTGICDCVFCEEDVICGGLWFGEEKGGNADNFVSGTNLSFSQPNASCQQLLMPPFCPLAFLSTDEDSYSCLPLYQRS